MSLRRVFVCVQRTAFDGRPWLFSRMQFRSVSLPNINQRSLNGMQSRLCDIKGVRNMRRAPEAEWQKTQLPS